MSEAPSGYCGPGTEINEQIMRQANEPLIGRSSLSELNLWTIKGKVVFRLQEYAALVRARIGIPLADPSLALSPLAQQISVEIR